MRFTVVALATLLSKHRNITLKIRPEMTEESTCRVIAGLYGVHMGGNQLYSFKLLSEKLRSRLSERRVRALPEYFYPLAENNPMEQEVLIRSCLDWLKEKQRVDITWEGSLEKWLFSCAEICGLLCFKWDYDMPSELSDEMLPDLLSKLTIMESGDLELSHRCI